MSGMLYKSDVDVMCGCFVLMTVKPSCSKSVGE